MSSPLSSAKPLPATPVKLDKDAQSIAPTQSTSSNRIWERVTAISGTILAIIAAVAAIALLAFAFVFTVPAIFATVALIAAPSAAILASIALIVNCVIHKKAVKEQSLEKGVDAEKIVPQRSPLKASDGARQIEFQKNRADENEKTLRETRIKCEKLEKENIELTAKVQAHASPVKGKKGALEELNVRATTAEAQVMEYRKQIDELAQTVSSAKAIMQRQDEKIARLEDDITEYKEAYEESNKVSDQSIREAEKSELELEKVKAELAETKKELTLSRQNSAQSTPVGTPSPHSTVQRTGSVKDIAGAFGIKKPNSAKK